MKQGINQLDQPIVFPAFAVITVLWKILILFPTVIDFLTFLISRSAPPLRRLRTSLQMFDADGGCNPKSAMAILRAILTEYRPRFLDCAREDHRFSFQDKLNILQREIVDRTRMKGGALRLFERGAGMFLPSVRRGMLRPLSSR